MQVVTVQVVTVAAVGAAGLFGLVAAFQVALALGAPWGQAAWGGTRAGVLTPPLRVASGFSAVVLVLAAVAVLIRAGLIGASPPAFLRWVVWGLAAFLMLNAFGNALSESRSEKWIMGPAAGITGGLCALVAWLS